MSDARAMGLLPYMMPGEHNAMIMSEHGVTDNAMYRALITANGKDIATASLEQALRRLEPVDQGCVPEAVSGIAPVAASPFYAG